MSPKDPAYLSQVPLPGQGHCSCAKSLRPDGSQWVLSSLYSPASSEKGREAAVARLDMCNTL